MKTWITALFLTLMITSTAQAKLPNSLEALAVSYQEAHKNKDQALFEKLVYWEGVSEKDRDNLLNSFKADLNFEIEKVELKDLPTDQITEYVLGGITYRPNLKPIKKLTITYKTTASSINFTGRGYLVGEHSGTYFITTAAAVR